MKLACYFNNLHLPDFSWQDFLEGKIGLSGTDTRNMYLPWLLQRELGYQAILYVRKGIEGITGLKQMEVSSIKGAVKLAKKEQVDFFIFSFRRNQETMIGIDTIESHQIQTVLTSGNPIDKEYANRIAEASSIIRLVVVSRWQADALRDHPVFKKMSFIPNLFDAERFPDVGNATRSMKSVFFLGSLTPSKGFHHLAKAWPKIIREYPGASLKVLGSARLYNDDAKLGPLGIAEASYEKEITPYIGETREEAESLGIEFLGLASPALIKKIALESGIAVINPNCSGSFECCSNASLEAQAFGAAVISAKRGGIPETVKNNNSGELINRQQLLARKVIQLLKNTSKAEYYGNQGSERVANYYGKKRILALWDHLFRDLKSGEEIASIPISCGSLNAKLIYREIKRRLSNVI